MSSKEIKRGRFAAIVQAAAAEESEPVELAPTAQAKPVNGSSKKKTMKGATFYIPHDLSIELDRFVMEYNLSAERTEIIDRSQIVELLLKTLIELGKSKGTSALSLMRSKC